MAIYLYALFATLPEEGRKLNATERQHFETQLQERSSHPEKLMIEFQHIPLTSQGLNVVNGIRFTEVSMRLAKVNVAERPSIDRFNNRLFSGKMREKLSDHGRYVDGESTVVFNSQSVWHDTLTAGRTRKLESGIFNGAVWVHKTPHLNRVTIGRTNEIIEASRFFPLTKDTRTWRLFDRYRPELIVDDDDLKARYTFPNEQSWEFLFTWPECRLLKATQFHGTKVRTAKFWLRNPSSGGVVPDAIYDLVFNRNERLTSGHILLIHKSTTDVKLRDGNSAVAADSGTMLFDYRQGRRPKPQLLEKQTPNVLQLNVD